MGVCPTGRKALFYATAGYTRSATDFADSKHLALFIISADSSVRPVNHEAHSLVVEQPFSGQGARVTDRSKRKDIELSKQRAGVRDRVEKVQARLAAAEYLVPSRHTYYTLKAAKKASRELVKAESWLRKSEEGHRTRTDRGRCIARADAAARAAAARLGVR